jgi:hypothetical protein
VIPTAISGSGKCPELGGKPPLGKSCIIMTEDLPFIFRRPVKPVFWGWH